MTKEEHGGTEEGFTSLKWKVLAVISAALVFVNVSIASLVYFRAMDQLDSEQEGRRQAQLRELNVVLQKGREAISIFASFIPLLSSSEHAGNLQSYRNLMPVILREHGLLFAIEWGFEGVHFYDANDIRVPLASWPKKRVAPPVSLSLETVQSEEVSSAQLFCDEGCYQVVSLPLLNSGKTVGFLVVERSVTDAFMEFNLLSGADLAVLKGEFNDASSTDHLIAWRRRISAINNKQVVSRVLEDLSKSVGLQDLLSEPKRLKLGDEWYEVFNALITPEQETVNVLVINRVTTQVKAVSDATKDSFILGLIGLVFSELILLFMLSGPMRRIQDMVYVLPLLADKSYDFLRSTLRDGAANRRSVDEIDLMMDALCDVSEQIEVEEKARRVAEASLRSSRQALNMAQKMARVDSWSGYPVEGGFQIEEGKGRVGKILEHVKSWAEFIRYVHYEDRSRLKIAWHRGWPGYTLDLEFRLLSASEWLDVHVVAEFAIVGPTRRLRASGMFQDVSAARAGQRALKNHHDILEAKVAERTRELSEATKRAERLANNKSRFLANVSHEIRTPMNAVLGLSQIGIKESDNPRVAETFETILKSGEHLLQVVNDVLDLSKIEAGKLEIVRKPFDLRNTLGTCADMIRLRVVEKSLHLDVSVSDGVPDRVEGDEFRIRQILINLLNNAVKFTKKGGVALSVEYDSGICVFRIKDTGVGMTANQVKGLFVSFQQFQNSAAGRHEGSGLGLSICRELACLMGGAIHVRSDLGVGSEFVLRLPLVGHMADKTDVVQPTHSLPDELDQLRGLRVLVADDVGMNRTVSEALLNAVGASTTLVSNGAEAVEAVTRNEVGHFDVILMDVQMPKMDGREASRRIKERHPDLPIIGLTAHVSEAEKQASLACGMDDQLVKPVMQEDLVSTVLRHVGKGPEVVPPAL